MPIITTKLHFKIGQTHQYIQEILHILDNSIYFSIITLIGDILHMLFRIKFTLCIINLKPF